MNYDKEIYEAKYGKKQFVDSLSKRQAYKNYADNTIKALTELFKTREIHYDRMFDWENSDKIYENEVGK